MDFIRTPVGGALAWGVLHALDYFMTLWGETERRRRADQVIVLSGSYELNPLFQKAVDGRHWFSARFFVTLFGIGALIAAMNAWVAEVPEGRAGQDGLLGVLLFTRTAIIARHVQNIWLFRRMATHPDSVKGQLVYERRTLLLVSATQVASLSALVVLAAILSPEPVLIGGALGMVLLTLLNVAVALKRQPAHAGTPVLAPPPKSF